MSEDGGHDPQGSVRPMALEDVGAVVEIHLAAFPAYFLTSLGPEFLALYYAEVVRSRLGIGFVFARDGRVLGFVAGEFSPGEFYRGLFLRRWYAFGFHALKAVATCPAILRRIARQVSQRLDAPRSENVVRLASLAVAPEEQGRQSGRALVAAFIEHVRKRGGRTIVLEARKEDPSVIQFYEQMGFKPVGGIARTPGDAPVELSYAIGDGQAGPAVL